MPWTWPPGHAGGEKPNGDGGKVNTGAFGELQALWAADNEPPGVANTVGGVAQGRVVCRS